MFTIIYLNINAFVFDTNVQTVLIFVVNKTVAVRSSISSKVMFLTIASCVWYFDRAYYGFYMTSWRINVHPLLLLRSPSDNVRHELQRWSLINTSLVEGNKIWQVCLYILEVYMYLDVQILASASAHKFGRTAAAPPPTPLHCTTWAHAKVHETDDWGKCCKMQDRGSTYYSTWYVPATFFERPHLESSTYEPHSTTDLSKKCKVFSIHDLVDYSIGPLVRKQALRNLA